jgi:hypothetical protein
VIVYTETESRGQWLAFLLRTREVLAVLNAVFCDFLLSINADAGKCLKLGHGRFVSFPFHYSLITS